MTDPTTELPDDGELSEDALDAVAGGIGSCTCPGACFQHTSVG